MSYELPAAVWRVVNDFDHASMRGHKELTISVDAFKAVVDYMYGMEFEIEEAYREQTRAEDREHDAQRTSELLADDLETAEKQRDRYKSMLCSVQLRIQAALDDNKP